MQKNTKNLFLKKFCRFYSAFFVFLFCVLLCSCSLFYCYEKNGAFGIGFSKIENSAFVSDVDYNYGDDKKIVLPSEYNGIKIKALGGYFGRGVPAPFCLSVDVKSILFGADEYYATSERYLYDKTTGWWDETEIVDCRVDIVLPEYLEKAEYLLLDEIFVAEFKKENGKTLAKIFRPTFSFSISENNKNFFTENGKLYYKNSGLLIDGIVYAENDFSQ